MKLNLTTVTIGILVLYIFAKTRVTNPLQAQQLAQLESGDYGGVNAGIVPISGLVPYVV